MAGFKLKWYPEAVNKRLSAAGKTALLKSGDDLVERSANEAPILIGDLRGNCSMNDDNLETKYYVLVGYNLVYAWRQHEGLDFNHPQGGKAKFLEDPYNANIDRYINFVKQAEAGAIQ